MRLCMICQLEALIPTDVPFNYRGGGPFALNTDGIETTMAVKYGPVFVYRNGANILWFLLVISAISYSRWLCST